MNRLAIISGFLGRVHNRYMVYQDARDLATRLEMAGRIEGADGIEACYPADFDSPAQLDELLKRHGLGVSAVNFRSRRTGKWLRGGFTSMVEAERREVVDDLKRAMDHAARLGCNRVTTCPLNDGTDVPFEADFAKLYDNAAECFAAACAHDTQVRVCIEYKKSDPMARCMFAGAGETAAFCMLVGADNLGATLDIGHAIIAEERPAQSAALLARAKRLFYVHLNDNDGRWDWDMLPGAYHLFETVELLYALPRLGYDDDWFAFDVYPKEVDTVANYAAAMSLTRKLEDIAERVDASRMDELMRERNPAKVVTYLYSLI